MSNVALHNVLFLILALSALAAFTARSPGGKRNLEMERELQIHCCSNVPDVHYADYSCFSLTCGLHAVGYKAALLTAVDSPNPVSAVPSHLPLFPRPELHCAGTMWETVWNRARKSNPVPYPVSHCFPHGTNSMLYRLGTRSQMTSYSANKV